MKGSAFRARFRYLAERFPDVWPAILAALRPETRAIADGALLDNAWYPFECFIDLNERAVQLAGQGDLSLVRAMGKHAAIANLPTIYRFFLRVGAPDAMLRKAATLWSVHHDTGSARAAMMSPRSAFFEVTDFGAPHPILCASLAGFNEAALELTGAKGVSVVEKACVTRGAPACRFEGTWL